MRRRELVFMMTPAVLLMGLLLTVPFAYSVLWSFQDVDYGGDGVWVGSDKYAQALGDPLFRDAVAFSVGFAIAKTAFLVVLGYALALLMNRARRGRSVFLGFLLVPYVIPSVIAATAFAWLFDESFGGLVNFVLEKLTGQQVLWFTETWPNRALVLGDSVWNEIPFVMIILLSALKAVPPDQIEAAKVDGATWWQGQRHVVIPTLGPMFRLIVLISIMDGLRVFDALIPLAPNAESIGTQSVSLYVFRQAFARSQQDLGLGSAVNMLMFVVMAALIAPFIRQIYREVTGK